MEDNKMLIAIVGVLVVGVLGFMLFSGGSETEEAVESPAQEAESRRVQEVGQVQDESEKMMDKKQSIVEIAVSNDDFSTLVAALTAADLVDTLAGPGPFTVFAPTNDAFAKIPEAGLAAILANKEQLTGILTYHVVPGKVMAADVVNLSSAPTVNGQELTVTVEGGMVMINDSKVITTDIEASNGVIHVIDTVLLPQ